MSVHETRLFKNMVSVAKVELKLHRIDNNTTEIMKKVFFEHFELD